MRRVTPPQSTRPLHRRDYSVRASGVPVAGDPVRHPLQRAIVKYPLPFFIASLACSIASISWAQVSYPEPPPKPPTYTPEQLFGNRPPPSSAPNPATSGVTITQPSPIPSGSTTAPATTAQSPIASATTAPPARPAGSCPVVTAPPSAASPFPGVPASQFPRAGVGAEAFTRPGVSAEQLRALLPGNAGSGGSTCQTPREVVLYPEPVNQPRPVPQTSDGQPN
jgi:hypothetical protein